MGRIVPFSDVDQYFKGLDLSNGCIADTNFLIAISDKENVFFEEAQFLWEKLSEYRVPLYVSVTAKSEFVDFHRRVIITETLMDMLAASSKWKISAAVREILRSQKGWIDNQDDPYLTDARIKICKQVFTPENHSGHIGWLELCNEYLVGRLLNAWDKISEDLSLNYIDMRADDTKDLFRKQLKWSGMCLFAEQTAVGSGDAMILNMFESTICPFAITSDYDLAYGVLHCTTDKVVLVPDRLYRNHFRKMKSSLGV